MQTGLTGLRHGSRGLQEGSGRGNGKEETLGVIGMFTPSIMSNLPNCLL